MTKALLDEPTEAVIEKVARALARSDGVPDEAPLGDYVRNAKDVLLALCSSAPQEPVVDDECAWCRGNREHGEICACNAPEPVADMLGALKGLLEIEDARIGTGIFKPNAEAWRRIEAAREIVARLQAKAPDR